MNSGSYQHNRFPRLKFLNSLSFKDIIVGNLLISGFPLMRRNHNHVDIAAIRGLYKQVLLEVILRFVLVDGSHSL
jgi:hypothetical protein